MFQPRERIDYWTTRPWDDRTETPLLRDVAFNKHSMNDGHHVSPYDNAKVCIGTDGIIVKLVQGLHPDFEKVLSKATRATIGINLDVPDDDTRDWQEMLQGGLQTALESQVVVFEISGVSRTCTHQLVRTRKAAFHQQSQRASFYGVQPEFRMPESVWLAPDDVRLLWTEAMDKAHQAYNAACEADISYQDARNILPEGTTNYILCEYSLREFINVYAYRGCSMFSNEIVSVMRACREILVAEYPFLDPYVKISCEKTQGAKDSTLPGDHYSTVLAKQGEGAFSHTCTFQGWEKVEGQCPFAWARDTNRTFRSEKHEIGK